jgi:hypothetical protein
MQRIYGLFLIKKDRHFWRSSLISFYCFSISFSSTLTFDLRDLR